MSQKKITQFNVSNFPPILHQGTPEPKLVCQGVCQQTLNVEVNLLVMGGIPVIAPCIPMTGQMQRPNPIGSGIVASQMTSEGVLMEPIMIHRIINGIEYLPDLGWEEANVLSLATVLLGTPEDDGIPRIVMNSTGVRVEADRDDVIELIGADTFAAIETSYPDPNALVDLLRVCQMSGIGVDLTQVKAAVAARKIGYIEALASYGIDTPEVCERRQAIRDERMQPFEDTLRMLAYRLYGRYDDIAERALRDTFAEVFETVGPIDDKVVAIDMVAWRVKARYYEAIGSRYRNVPLSIECFCDDPKCPINMIGGRLGSLMSNLADGSLVTQAAQLAADFDDNGNDTVTISQRMERLARAFTDGERQDPLLQREAGTETALLKDGSATDGNC